jgi:hypothetical protein
MQDPLSNFYRTKEVYVTLPSGGRWYKSKPNLTADGEIGIYPMSVKDEIMLKIPDTLFNGEALYEVLQSIAPDIVDPYEVAVPDVEVILLAAKASQHNGELSMSCLCPHCNKSNQYSVEIKTLLASIRPLPEEPLVVELENGLSVKYKPNTLASITAGAIKTTESIRLASAISDGMDPEQTKSVMRESLEKSTAAAVIVLADSIESITTPDGTVVTDVQSISNYIANADAKTTSIIKRHSTTLNNTGVPSEFDFVCNNEQCEQSFKSPIEYNPAFFFTADSDRLLI